MTATTRLLVGPFNRVEGDLEVSLDIGADRVVSARVNAPMYRGFENMMRGRAPLDALVIVPRICGICSVSQSLAAVRALAQLQGLQPTDNGAHLANIVAATENLADHLTHFHLFFLPDFIRPVYAHHRWHGLACARHDPHRGDRTRESLAARQHAFGILGIMAGKWPHTHGLQPGGSTRTLEAVELQRVRARIRALRSFLERQVFGMSSAALLACTSRAELETAATDPRSDLALFLDIARDTGLWQLGPGPRQYLSHGAYPLPGTLPLSAGHTTAGRCALRAGQILAPDAAVEALRLDTLTEDATHAWYADSDGPLHPSRGDTQPLADKALAYTWNKAPRLAGRVIETGALARQVIDGQPLMAGLEAEYGGVVATRVLARLVELARVPAMMEAWVQAIEPQAPWCHPGTERWPDGEAVGLTEAARGALGHWLAVRNGRISHYQIVAPTSWNFSPRDRHQIPGALEQALVDAPILPGETTPVSVQHIVRSFDPCMVCTVH